VKRCCHLIGVSDADAIRLFFAGCCTHSPVVGPSAKLRMFVFPPCSLHPNSWVLVPALVVAFDRV